MPDDGLQVVQPARDQLIVAEHAEPLRRRLVLVACLMAGFITALEGSITATAVPTLVSDLGGFDLFSWLFTIYMLTQAVSIPIYGRLADLYGRKRVFFFGTGLFLAGSALCGFAWGMVPLICFRALQGFGAGAVQPIAATILGDIYTPTERARIQGVVSCVFGAAAVLGPSLGAFLIEHVSWPAIFWVNLPVGVLSIAMISAFLKETVQPRRHRIDWQGSLLLLTASGALMLALVQGGTIGLPMLAVFCAIGITALILLCLHERTVPEPTLPLELWRNRVIVAGSLGCGSAAAVMMGVSTSLPTYVQGAMGHSAVAGGLVLGVMSVSWALASVFAGWVMAHTTYRVVASLGATALLAGCGMLTLLTPEDGLVPAILGSLIIGVGMGFCITVFMVSVQSAVPWQQRGAATSSVMFLRFIGQAVGAAGCGAALNATLLHLDPTASHMVDKLLDSGTRAAMAPAEVAHLTGLIARSLQNEYLLAGGFALATLLIALQLPPRLSPAQQTMERRRA